MCSAGTISALYPSLLPDAGHNSAIALYFPQNSAQKLGYDDKYSYLMTAQSKRLARARQVCRPTHIAASQVNQKPPPPDIRMRPEMAGALITHEKQRTPGAPVGYPANERAMASQAAQQAASGNDR